MPLLLAQATVEPVMLAGRLSAPLMYLHWVLVTPHAFDAYAQISHPELFAGIGPSVKVAVGTVVVTGLG